MSQIVVQRIESRWQDRMRDYRIVVNDREAVRVGNGSSAVFAVEPGRHTVHLALDWCRSRPLEVDVGPGQTVRLECGPNVKPFLALVYAVFLFRRWMWLRPAGGTDF